MDRINMAVVEHRGIKFRGLLGVAIEPEARGYARHRDCPPERRGVGGLIGSLYQTTAERRSMRPEPASKSAYLKMYQNKMLRSPLGRCETFAQIDPGNQREFLPT